jgi:phytol kinase
MVLILNIIVIFGLLLFNELWWRKHAMHSEFSRKFIHVTVGSIVAFWPFFLSWRQIEILSLVFLVAILLSKQLHLFKAIHSVQRPTWGELFFAMSVGAIALLTHNKWIYAASLLQMSLADGLAAIIGTRYGKQNYLVFGHTKSIVGSLTFLLVSLGILLSLWHLGYISIGVGTIILISALATVLENLAVQGLDNLAVPLLVALMLIYH